MQKRARKRNLGFTFLFFTLFFSAFGVSSASALTEPGFRDRLGLYPARTVNDADNLLKEISARYSVPIALETGRALDVTPDPDSIVVRISISGKEYKAEAAIGGLVKKRGMFKDEDGNKLVQSMNAALKESYSDAAIYAGIEFLQNTFDSKIQGTSPSNDWERYLLVGLVFAFVFLVLVIFLFDNGNSNSELSFHHPSSE